MRASGSRSQGSCSRIFQGFKGFLRGAAVRQGLLPPTLNGNGVNSPRVALVCALQDRAVIIGWVGELKATRKVQWRVQMI